MRIRDGCVLKERRIIRAPIGDTTPCGGRSILHGQASLPVPSDEGAAYALKYTRLPEEILVQSGIIVKIEWPTAPAGPWSAFGVTEETLSSNGGNCRVKALILQRNRPRLFVRLRAEQ